MTGTVTKGKVIREDLDLWDGITLTTSRTSSSGGTTSGLRLNDIVDLLTVYGGGDQYTQATVQAAIDALGSNNVGLLFSPGAWVFSSNITIPANFTLIIPAGATLEPASGVTVTVSGATFRYHGTYTGGDGTVTLNGHDSMASASATDTYAADTGAADAYVIDVASNPSSYTAGQVFRFKAANANTGASTLNVDSLGVKDIKRNQTDALEANDILANDIITVVYDGTNFLMQPTHKSVENHLGTVATKDTGTAEGNIPLLDATGLPAVDGSQLTGIAYDMELVATASASAVASVDFTALSSTYHAYLCIFDAIIPATDNGHLHFRTSADNGSSFDEGASDYEWAVLSVNTVQATNQNSVDTADSEIQLSRETLGNAAGEICSGWVMVYDPSATNRTMMSYQLVNFRASDGALTHVIGAGSRKASAAVDAIRFLMSSGNITSGEFRLYGVRDA